MRIGGRILLCLGLLAVFTGALWRTCEAQEGREAPPGSVTAVRDTIWLSETGQPVGVQVERGFVTGLFRRGGPVMYPILLCSLAGLAIIVVKVVELRASRVVPDRLVSGVGVRWSSGDVSGATALTEARDCSMGRVLRAGLQMHGWGREDVVRAMESAGGREEAVLGRYVRSLGALAAVTPLLGILGTVLGMIKAFNVIAASGSRRPDLIADGISQALITTAAGLVVAIPLYLCFHYFRGKIERLLSTMEAAAAGTARNVFGKARVPEQTPSEPGGAGL